MTIGQKIREIRLEKGMTLDQVGNICGMAKQQLQLLEEHGGYPRIQTIIRIADAMQCTVRDILDEPLELGYESVSHEIPCANAEKCPFFKKKD